MEKEDIIQALHNMKDDFAFLAESDAGRLDYINERINELIERIQD